MNYVNQVNHANQANQPNQANPVFQANELNQVNHVNQSAVLWPLFSPVTGNCKTVCLHICQSASLRIHTQLCYLVLCYCFTLFALMGLRTTIGVSFNR